MKLELALNYLNSFEKNSFLKIIDSILSKKPKNSKAVNSLLDDLDGRLKDADSLSIARVLSLVKDEFSTLIEAEFLNTTSQFDILIDIISRDGNSLMKREWLGRLYETEVRKIKAKLKDFKSALESEANDPRLRDYKIYLECLRTAYENDRKNNQENKITKDEQSILISLSGQLELSHEETKLINYSIVPLNKLDIDEIIKYLTAIGAIFYSRKNHQVYVADQVVDILREIRGKEVPDKVFRKVLKHLRDSHINQLSRKHSIDWKLPRESKIQEIINEGISFKGALSNGIYKEDVSKTDRKAFFNELVEKKLKIDTHIKGTTIESKVDHLIEYFLNQEKDGSISISMSGYNKLLKDLSKSTKGLKAKIKKVFQLQEDSIMDANFLLNYNIKPTDVLYLLDASEIRLFCQEKEVSLRGNEILNILSKYKDVENLLIENYGNIALRDYNLLVENGLDIPEAELGIKFESVTKSILRKLGLEVDDSLRQSLSSSKNKIDIVVKTGESEIIIVECKSIKERGYNKYSSVSRQVNSYKKVAEDKGFSVKKIFIVAPSFTDDFVNECGLDYELNLSLITADTLSDIYSVFQESSRSELPISLLMRDVLIDKERVCKAILK